jgi:hypothetical protein
MSAPVSRRALLVSTVGLGLDSAAARLFGPLPARAAAPAGARAVHDAFPSQDPQEVRAVVLAAHRDLDEVRRRVEARPALAKSAWDWGFGDWESALGAASHMGRRDIAELLMAHGARPDLFTAAMLGQLEVVRSWVESSPGVQGIRGPHGITLLAHARAGGAAAAAVADWLEEKGGADPPLATVPLDADDRARLTGFYAFGPGDADRLEVYESRERLMIRRGDRIGRVMRPLGEGVFFPAGADAVRIRFSPAGQKASALTVHDPGPVLEARRI